MSARRFSPWRLLRSRRLAIGLILGVAAYAVLGTVVPQASVSTGGTDVGRFAAAHPFLAALTRPLGLHQAFSSPIFLALLGLLALSTVACAWERTTVSWRLFSRAGDVSEADIRRLRERPLIVVPVASEEAGVLERVEAGLRRLRLRVRRGPKLIEASAGRGGLLGSPLFHVTLAVLFLVIAVGRLSRSEGVLAVPIGSSVPDSHEAYARVAEGPLYPGHSGLEIAASDLVFEYRDKDGNQRGPSPVVSIRSGGRLLASRHVYPNAPLRERGLMVHMAGYGLAPVFELRSADGSMIGTACATIDFDARQASGTKTGGLDILGPDGSVRHVLRVAVPADWNGKLPVGRVPRDPQAQISVERSAAAPVTLRPGQSMEGPEGMRVKLLSIGYYARLTVADDWSIYPIYVLFLIAGVAMSVAVVMPYRTVQVLLTAGPGGPELHAVLRHRRGDPLFEERVEAALREAATVAPSEEEESA